MNNKSEGNPRSSNSWGEDIDRAMKQIEKPISKTKSAVSKSYSIPPWVFYVSIVIFFILIVHRAPSYADPHPVAQNRDLETGPRVAMLIVAEEIERYRLEKGNLPEELPSVLGIALDIEYERISNNKFELQMDSKEGKLVLNDNSSTISVL